MKTILKSLAVAGLMAPFVAKAQMPNDAIYMGKKQLCVAGMYGYSSWSQYWENTLKRENFNIGTHTTQSVMVMPAYGISNRVNVILSLPYVWTSTSAGNLMGQHGIQDLAAWLFAQCHRGWVSSHWELCAEFPSDVDWVTVSHLYRPVAGEL